MEASQSCQFILRLNMRTISILARIACDELQDVVDRGELTPKGKSVEEEPIKISPVMEKILPLLRLYTSWLGSVRLQVVQYEDHLEPHVKDMYRYLAKCFSLLIEVFKDDNLATAEYLLHEDLETLGFQPLVHGDIPETFRIHYNEMTGVDKQRGSGTGSKKREGINRVRDIIACGLHLAEDEKFPFGVSMQRKANGAEMPTVIYVEDGATSHGHPSALSPLDSHVSTLRAPDIASSAGPSVSTAAPESGIDEGADDSMEKRMVNMVNDLVSQSETGSENTTEGTSYGMHSTATVDQVLAAVASSSSQPPSALSEAIPSLPWRSSAGAGPSIGSSAQADQLQQGRETLEDPFFTMEVKDIPRFSWDRISPTSWGHPPSASQREQGMKILEKKIAEFTTNEAGERAPLNNTLGYNSTGQADTTDDWSSPIHAAAALYSPYHQPAQAPVASPYAHHHLAGPSSAISPYGHYQPTSTPRLGGPHQRIAQASPWGQTPTRQRTVQMPSIGSAFDQQISPAPQDRLQTASPYAVARPNQNQQHVGPPRTGLPMSLSSPAVTGNVYQSTPCNGITYNATTAYGRGDIVTRDDPTAYRNMARASGLSDDADAYDRAVLMRALEDDVKR